MLKFDKVKIISSTNNISNINENEFENKIKDGCLIEQRYTMMSPYYLYIEIDYIEAELVLEFTGKILKDDYSASINIDNIKQCLCNINDLRLCNLNIEAIITDGEIVKADVCTDVEYADCKYLTKMLRANVSNYSKYLARVISGNFVIEKNVQTKGYKRRLTIYDKFKEISKACNREFLSTLNNKQTLLNSFKDKVRFELNLNSKQQIRDSLNILDTSIVTVLGSNANPIWDFLNLAICDEAKNGGSHRSSLQEFKNILLLEYCNYDMNKVEAIIRQYCSPKTHIGQAMEPYRNLLAKLTEQSTSSLKDTLRKLLTEIVILIGIVSI